MAVELTSHERAFLSALGGIHRQWVAAAGEAVSAESIPVWVDDSERIAVLRQALSTPEAKQAFVVFVSELIAGALHSTVVCLDGGSNQPDTEQITVAGADGEAFRKYLHEFIFSFVAIDKNET
jgi:hypothetical protein